MLLKRFYHEGLAQASYLIGCQKTGEAIVIDANRDAQQYLSAAEDNGVRITHVSETHIHADYLSGSRELAIRTGARLLLSDEGGDDWRYAFAERDGATLLQDGDSFMVGNLRFDVVHTPGHTPEHIVFVITDTPSGPHPVGALTGDFIFVGDVGRPDLLERAAHIEGTMRAGASHLFHSLRRFEAAYPDYLQLWPGHGSGSACGKALGAVPQTTLGYEKLSNWAFQIPNEAQFIEAVLEGQPDPPVYFATMKQLNRDGPPLIADQPVLSHMDASAFDRVVASGAVLLDLRAAEVAAQAFLPGTLNVPLNKSFVGWCGWLVGYDRDIYLLTDDNADAVPRRARAELSMIGLDRVTGWFGADLLSAWRSWGRDFDHIPQVEPNALEEEMRSGEVTVVDVRAISEWESGHLGGAMLSPLGRLPNTLGKLADTSRLVMQCQAGGRSAIAASLARLHGHTNVSNLRGGYLAWQDAGLPTERDPVPAAH